MMKCFIRCIVPLLASFLFRPSCAPAKIEFTDLVFKNVTLIPMTGEKVVPGCSVYVAGGKIKAVGEFEELNAPAAAAVLDALGKYLVPGFSDMHVHVKKKTNRYFTGYVFLDESEEIINLTVQSGAWNCPTMSIRPKSVLLKTLYDRGARIVSGTDTGSGYIPAKPGFSLHEEFELMQQEAGLAPYQVLLTTTVNPARMVGIENRLGTIEAGKDADLVLLDKNPLEDIKNTRAIAGVMVKGTWLPKEKLAQMLAEVERKMKK